MPERTKSNHTNKSALTSKPFLRFRIKLHRWTTYTGGKMSCDSCS